MIMGIAMKTDLMMHNHSDNDINACTEIFVVLMFYISAYHYNYML